MSCKRISYISPEDMPEPLEIRVIKRWIPFARRQEKRIELCYLFVDIYGDAIEAIADLAVEAYFDSIIELQKCYTFDKYVSIPSRTYMAVIPHRASLKIDYIGRVEKVSPILIRSGKRLKKITIQDERYIIKVINISNIISSSDDLYRRNVLEITLWGEKADEVETDKAFGKTLAVTSTIVTEYNAALQLESTAATTTAINPPIANLQTYLNRFMDLGDPAAGHPLDKRVKIADLLNKAKSLYMHREHY